MYYLIRVLYISHAKEYEPLLVVFHWLILLILLFYFFKKREKAKAFGYLFSLIIIFVVGLGTCVSLYFGDLNMESKQMVDSCQKADSIAQARLTDSLFIKPDSAR
jgi:hypothetical protein